MDDRTDNPADKANPLNLPRVAEPPAALKARVLGTLRNEGLLASQASAHPRTPLRRRLAFAAAAVVLFAVGFGAHALTTSTSDTPPVVGDRYVLLLYGDVDPGPGRTEADVVAEYGAWAGSLAAQGHLELGEKLANDDPAGVEGTVSGFFIIRARSADEARVIADDCPHNRYGGELRLRRIEET
jgi:hypothetical protein